ncbi:alpha/beta hydrolase [Streptomyces phaeochromogenes]|uniref:alpha/beta hydrolase n=1 Tax=Streptomyces phaeochromogenes TaxID=1923 RepID=UPI002DDB38FC|nr:alpha/beta hydrolase-fold protein [Streptomyces phaeochromogenes]WRZ34579.1 alpha/beta hydrolase-fold protein [Streptomyces phaeochromogenes]
MAEELNEAEETKDPFAGWPGLPVKDRAGYAYSMSGDEPYTLGTDSLPKPGVPVGTVTKHEWTGSKVYPLTSRDYWVYVPAQYTPDEPACLMVFQDGDMYMGPGANVPTVFDNLIHSGEMPVTIGLFVSPGSPGPGTPVYGGTGNRQVEYDTTNGEYASLIVDELLPELRKTHHITDDPDGRAICGISSGAVCAFTAAWFRPDQFRKVVSHCGSFIDIHGAHNYPTWIRRHSRRPIKVFLQTGKKDLDIALGNIPLANDQMASALRYSDYDFQYVVGEGGHTLMHGAQLFPDTMRWIWKDHKNTEN